jgi:Tol biopolymer transport system component
MRPIRALLGLHEPLSRPGDHRRRASLLLAAVLVVGSATGVAAARLTGPTFTDGHSEAGGALIRPAGGGGVLQPVPAAPAGSLETPGTTSRVSIESGGGQLTGPSGHPSISADGRYVVFRTSFTTSSGIDLGRILLRDRVAGTTTVVATGSISGLTAVFVATVGQPVISGDGLWVAYVVGASSANQPTGAIRMWDRTGGVSSDAFGPRQGTFADQPALSFDGRYLAFRTDGALVRDDTNQAQDIYVYDRTAATFERVSVGPGGSNGNGGASSEPTISASGRYVAFSSTMNGLVGLAARIRVSQVYLRDRDQGTTRLLSAGPSGQPGNGPSRGSSISSDGAVVAFTSAASDLAAGDTNAVADIFAWTASGLGLVSVDPAGGQAGAASGQPAVSGDGRSVAFVSGATNLVAADGNKVDDIFVRDLVAARTTRVSVAVGPAETNATSAFPVMSGNGAVVAFESDATNLVRGDTNQVRDVFARVRPATLSLAPDPVDFGTVAVNSPAATRPVTATNAGPGPVTFGSSAITGSEAVGFTLVFDGCVGRTLFLDESCQIAVSLSTVAIGAIAATLQVKDSTTDSPQLVTLRALALPAARTRIEVSPTVGPAGMVTIVTGSGFAPGQPVTLSWSVGITPTPLGPIVAGADGSFTAQALILPNDLRGPRTLIAASPSGSPSATADFLVTTRTSTPPVSPFIRLAVPYPNRPLISRH